MCDDRATFTQNEDFLRLAAANIPHAGIVYAPQHTPVSEIITGLMLICQVLDAGEMKDHVEFL